MLTPPPPLLRCLPRILLDVVRGWEGVGVLRLRGRCFFDARASAVLCQLAPRYWPWEKGKGKGGGLGRKRGAGGTAGVTVGGRGGW